MWQTYSEEQACKEAFESAELDRSVLGNRSGTNREGDHFELPLCLSLEWKKRGIMHFIRKCEWSDESTKTALFGEDRRIKRARAEEPRKGKLKLGQSVETFFSPHSSLFRKSFAKKVLETIFMAYQRVSTNFIRAQLVEGIKNNIPK